MNMHFLGSIINFFSLFKVLRASKRHDTVFFETKEFNIIGPLFDETTSLNDACQ